MAATVTTQVGKGDSASATTTLETASFTPTGSNKVIYALVGCGASSPGSPNSVKYASTAGTGGEAMTLLDSVRVLNTNVKTSVWRLANPSASSGTIWAQYAAANDERWIIAVAVQDAAGTESTPIYATANISNTAAVTATGTTSGELVLSFVSWLDSTAGASQTITASQTSVYELEGNTPSTGGANNISPYEEAGISKTTAGGTTQAMGWTFASGGGLPDWGIHAFQVNPYVAPSVPPPVDNVIWLL